MNYFDLHCDTPYECYTKNEDFNFNSLAVSGELGKDFEKWTQTFAIWIKDDTQNPFELYKKILNDFKLKLLHKPKNLNPVFAVEGGAVLETDISRLDILKKDKIKFITLTWNGENDIAGGSKSLKGLTNFGKEVILKMNSLRMGCDLSHLNSKSFFEAVKIARYPLATHSNCHAVCNHPRNLTDEQLQMIAQKNGIIGLCFYPDFLGGDVYCKLYENICHMCSLGLCDNISIGSDFDGGVMHKKLQNIGQISNLYLFLEKKGLKKPFLNKIFFENANNFIEILSGK